MSVARSGRLVLKEDEVFLVCNERGNITATQAGAGLYLRDMRYLSLFNLMLNGEPFALLSSSAERIYLGLVHGSARALRAADGTTVLPQTIGLTRRRIVRAGLREELELHNYNRFPVAVRLTIELAADFRDMFEVRGFRRQRVGRLVPPTTGQEGRQLVLGYRSPDARALETEVRFNRAPTEQVVRGAADVATTRTPYGDELLLLHPVGERPDPTPPRRPAVVESHFDLTLPPAGTQRLELTITPRELGDGPPRAAFARAVHEAEARYAEWAEGCTAVETDNPQFDAFLERSARDIHALLTHFPGGRLIAAGIPWYVAPFGRDSLIAAHQTLMLRPALAVDTLAYLAQFQGRAVDEATARWHDVEPGKILHEMRVGEMARLGEVPHAPYYGTIDATPLYVMLFAATVRWLDDDALFRALLPTVRDCLEWLDRYGDRDGDGYVEYASHSRRGIRNQGWKDSVDSILWPDGSQPDLPIALAEVQGYAYAAKQWLSELLVERAEPGEEELTAWAARLAEEAADLKARFNRDFWRPEARTFGMGLDGQKRLVPAMTTNPGHGLWCGIVDGERAGALVARLLAPDMDGGWGIRTLSAAEPQYNPMSYHNGTVWPHDNSLIVAGLRRNGYAHEANRVIGELFDAAQTFRYLRLPELYCGFPRDPALDPTPAEYPVSCSPQAWAAGTAYLCLQSILGLRPGPGSDGVTLDPVLPPWLNRLRLRRLRVGRGTLDLLVRQATGDRASVEVLDASGGMRVSTPASS